MDNWLGKPGQGNGPSLLYPYAVKSLSDISFSDVHVGLLSSFFHPKRIPPQRGMRISIRWGKCSYYYQNIKGAIVISQLQGALKVNYLN